jgi:hypothetical protein
MGGADQCKQGMLEASNVNVVEELVDMIECQRAYEINSKMISLGRRDAAQRQPDAVRVTMRYLAALGAIARWHATQPCAKPKGPKPGFEATLPAPPPPPRAADGAIFNSGDGLCARSIRATAPRKVGDPVTIVLIENGSPHRKPPDRKAASPVGLASLRRPPARSAFLKPDSLKMPGETSFKGDGNANADEHARRRGVGHHRRSAPQRDRAGSRRKAS